MARNVFDDGDNFWGEPESKSIWDLDEDDSLQEESRSFKFNFKLNPKTAALSVASILSIAVLASVVPGLLGGSDTPKPEPTVVQSSPAQNPGITRPDDKTGYQIQLVYVETSSAAGSNYDKNGQIANWVAQLQSWLREKTGKELIFDTYKGTVDITYLKLDGNILKSGKEVEKLIQNYRELNPTTYFGKTLAFVVDQVSPVGWTACGWAGNFTDYALIFPNLTYPDGGKCGDLEEFAKINKGLPYEAEGLLHELVHSYGANHVCVDSTDLMQGSPECEKAGNIRDSDKPVTFDLSGRYYFGGNKSGVDLKNLKIWSDGSGQTHPDLNQGICWVNEVCPIEVNTFNEQGVVQLQVKSGADWLTVNSVEGQLSNCRDCYKYSFKNTHQFTKPGTFEYRIVKLSTSNYSTYTGPSESIRVLN